MGWVGVELTLSRHTVALPIAYHPIKRFGSAPSIRGGLLIWVDCAILDIFALLICIARDRLTEHLAFSPSRALRFCGERANYRAWGGHSSLAIWLTHVGASVASTICFPRPLTYLLYHKEHNKSTDFIWYFCLLHCQIVPTWKESTLNLCENKGNPSINQKP